MYFSNDATKKKEMRKRIAVNHLIASEHFKWEIHQENIYLYGSHCWCLLYKEHWTNDDWICYKLEKYNEIERMTERERESWSCLIIMDQDWDRRKRTETHNRVSGFCFFCSVSVFILIRNPVKEKLGRFSSFFNLIKNTFLTSCFTSEACLTISVLSCWFINAALNVFFVHHFTVF